MPKLGLSYPSIRHHATAGLDNQLAFLDSALDWVARQHAARHRDPLPGGHGHLLAQRRSTPARGLPEQRARVIAAFDELLGRRVSMRALALLRVLAGPVVLLHLRPFLSDSLDGRIYRDAFYEPYAGWYPEVPDAVYVGLLWLAAVSAVAMSLGLLTRLATATTFAIVAYNLFLSTTHFHNNRAYLVIVLGLLAVAPCGRELSVDAWLRRRRGLPALDLTAPAWPLWLLRFECAAIYAASGISKLVDPDWFGGTVTWQRVVRVRDELEASPFRSGRCRSSPTGAFTPEQPSSSSSPSCSSRSGCGGVVAATWPCGSPSPFTSGSRCRRRCRSFRFSAIAVLVVWAVPSTRDRVIAIDSTDPRQRRLGAAVRGLDWLARFRVEPAPPGTPLEVTERDGTTLRGGPAVAFAFSRLPADGVVRAPHPPPARRPPGPQRDDRSSRLAGRPDPGADPGRRVRGGGSPRALPVGHHGRAPRLGAGERRLVRPQPGRAMAGGSTSTTPTRTRPRRSTTRFATPG